jgi:hypothetical protein
MHRPVRLHCSCCRYQFAQPVSRLLTAHCWLRPPAPCSCVKKSGACGCSRRRSLQGAGYEQCDCCADLLCADNSTFTGFVCTGPPSDPGFGEITVTETETNLYMIEILLTASNDTGAVGMGAFWASNASSRNCWVLA